MTRALTACLVLVAACSDPAPSSPDAPAGTPDAPPSTPDAPPLPPDANPNCGADQLCITLQPVDGVTTLPAGRLAIAWMPPEGSGLTAVEVAYDALWLQAEVTSIDLSAITMPTGPYYAAIPNLCAGSRIGAATVVLSTDPDGDGAITSDEIAAGLADGTVYGVEQEIVAYFDVACAPMPPTFPEGFLAGIHVYTQADPVHRLDGMLTAMQTCAPQTAACANINTPF